MGHLAVSESRRQDDPSLAVRHGVATLALAFVLACSTCRVDAVESEGRADLSERQLKLNVEDAIARFEHASHERPNDPRILELLGRAHAKKGEWGKAVHVFDRAIALAPSFATYHYRRGCASLELAKNGNGRKLEVAGESFRECIRRDPLYAECHHFLGEVLERQQETTGALRAYSQAVRAEPQQGEFYAALAHAYFAHRLFEQAERVVELGDQMAPPTESWREERAELGSWLAAAARRRGGGHEESIPPEPPRTAGVE